ncbi:MAG TPA: divalent-cation tolerance protein CutA [Limnobacter sp.]|nr:divalent-cation tolerance protein CutA [Limnobacter sp.]
MDNSTACWVVYTHVASKAKASDMARALIEGRHAACVNMIGPVESVYEWQGKVETASEWMLMMKCSEQQLGGLKEAVLRLHDYDLPELIVLPITQGHAPYLEWIQASGRKTA